MKTTPTLAFVAFLLAAATAAGPCLAMITVAPVTPERAKEMGMEVRAKANGPNEVWLELEFKPEGKLKDFSHVSLEVRDGDKFLLGWNAMKGRPVGSGRVVVTLLASRAYLDKITLRVMVGRPADAGYDVRVKDFVDPAKIR